MTATATTPGIVSTLDELREILGLPKQRVIDKVQPQLDRFTRYFIERSPFLLIASSNHEGRCDVSPKGDQPGFVKILDDKTLLIPDRPGNKRADTFINLLENPQIGTIFLIPDVEETLRVNGAAVITSDREFLEQCSVTGKSPNLGIIVEVHESYFHCAKAFKRSGLWQPDTWQGRGDLPSLGEITAAQQAIIGSTGAELNSEIEEGYRTNLY